MSDTPALRPLRVSRKQAIARDIHLFELRDPTGAELPAFTAGAHLPMRVPNGAMRQYSLCGDPQITDCYQIAVKREAKIVADVDGWISEGRVQRAARDEYIAKHRQGKAAGIVRHIPAGAFTTGQRLSGGAVGSPVTDLPAKPETAVRSIAREVVARARNMDRSGAVAPAAQQSDVNPVRSDAKRIVERARNLRG